MTHKIKVMTVVGTRPEIIRLSATIKLLDKTTNHILVHTGQNYDYELNEVFFEDLGLRKPDYFLNADVSSLGATLGSILQGTEKVILQEKPDAMLILGDTNSCISAIMGKRMKVPVYHMEAGNRCFDENVPEETNRRLVDHVADYNLVYSEHARRNLLAEGIHPSRILLTGSPMREVLEKHKVEMQQSSILEKLELTSKGYFLVSLHREENVDNPILLNQALTSLHALSDKYHLPILLSAHPRTSKLLEEQPRDLKTRIKIHKPFGFFDYIHLQQNAFVVVSDSGTISEESSILGFPAVTMRDSIERPEAQDAGVIALAGLNKERLLNSVDITLKCWDEYQRKTPIDYGNDDFSKRTLMYIISTAKTHHQRNNITISAQ